MIDRANRKNNKKNTKKKAVTTTDSSSVSVRPRKVYATRMNSTRNLRQSTRNRKGSQPKASRRIIRKSSKVIKVTKSKTKTKVAVAAAAVSSTRRSNRLAGSKPEQPAPSTKSAKSQIPTPEESNGSEQEEELSTSSSPAESVDESAGLLNRKQFIVNYPSPTNSSKEGREYGSIFKSRKQTISNELPPSPGGRIVIPPGETAPASPSSSTTAAATTATATMAKTNGTSSATGATVNTGSKATSASDISTQENVERRGSGIPPAQELAHVHAHAHVHAQAHAHVPAHAYPHGHAQVPAPTPAPAQYAPARGTVIMTKPASHVRIMPVHSAPPPPTHTSPSVSHSSHHLPSSHPSSRDLSPHYLAAFPQHASFSSSAAQLGINQPNSQNHILFPTSQNYAPGAAPAPYLHFNPSQHRFAPPSNGPSQPIHVPIVAAIHQPSLESTALNNDYTSTIQYQTQLLALQQQHQQLQQQAHQKQLQQQQLQLQQQILQSLPPSGLRVDPPGVSINRTNRTANVPSKFVLNQPISSSQPSHTVSESARPVHHNQPATSQYIGPIVRSPVASYYSPLSLNGQPLMTTSAGHQPANVLSSQHAPAPMPPAPNNLSDNVANPIRQSSVISFGGAQPLRAHRNPSPAHSGGGEHHQHLSIHSLGAPLNLSIPKGAPHTESLASVNISANLEQDLRQRQVMMVQQIANYDEHRRQIMVHQLYPEPANANLENANNQPLQQQQLLQQETNLHSRQNETNKQNGRGRRQRQPKRPIPLAPSTDSSTASPTALPIPLHGQGLRSRGHPKKARIGAISSNPMDMPQSSPTNGPSIASAHSPIMDTSNHTRRQLEFDPDAKKRRGRPPKFRNKEEAAAAAAETKRSIDCTIDSVLEPSDASNDQTEQSNHEPIHAPKPIQHPKKRRLNGLANQDASPPVEVQMPNFPLPGQPFNSLYAHAPATVGNQLGFPLHLEPHQQQQQPQSIPQTQLQLELLKPIANIAQQQTLPNLDEPKKTYSKGLKLLEQRAANATGYSTDSFRVSAQTQTSTSAEQLQRLQAQQQQKQQQLLQEQQEQQHKVQQSSIAANSVAIEEEQRRMNAMMTPPAPPPPPVTPTIPIISQSRSSARVASLQNQNQLPPPPSGPARVNGPSKGYEIERPSPASSASQSSLSSLSPPSSTSPHNPGLSSRQATMAMTMPPPTPAAPSQSSSQQQAAAPEGAEEVANTDSTDDTTINSNISCLRHPRPDEPDQTVVPSAIARKSVNPRKPVNAKQPVNASQPVNESQPMNASQPVNARDGKYVFAQVPVVPSDQNQFMPYLQQKSQSSNAPIPQSGVVQAVNPIQAGQYDGQSSGVSSSANVAAQSQYSHGSVQPNFGPAPRRVSNQLKSTRQSAPPSASAAASVAPIVPPAPSSVVPVQTSSMSERASMQTNQNAHAAAHNKKAKYAREHSSSNATNSGHLHSVPKVSTASSTFAVSDNGARAAAATATRATTFTTSSASYNAAGGKSKTRKTYSRTNTTTTPVETVTTTTATTTLAKTSTTVTSSVSASMPSAATTSKINSGKAPKVTERLTTTIEEAVELPIVEQAVRVKRAYTRRKPLIRKGAKAKANVDTPSSSRPNDEPKIRLNNATAPDDQQPGGSGISRKRKLDKGKKEPNKKQKKEEEQKNDVSVFDFIDDDQEVVEMVKRREVVKKRVVVKRKEVVRRREKVQEEEVVRRKEVVVEQKVVRRIEEVEQDLNNQVVVDHSEDSKESGPPKSPGNPRRLAKSRKKKNAMSQRLDESPPFDPVLHDRMCWECHKAVVDAKDVPVERLVCCGGCSNTFHRKCVRPYKFYKILCMKKDGKKMKTAQPDLIEQSVEDAMKIEIFDHFKKRDEDDPTKPKENLSIMQVVLWLQNGKFHCHKCVRLEAGHLFSHEYGIMNPGWYPEKVGRTFHYAATVTERKHPEFSILDFAKYHNVIYKQIDLRSIAHKAYRDVYNSTEQFMHDIYKVVHNVLIIHDTQIARGETPTKDINELKKQLDHMVRCAQQEADHIDQCDACYRAYFESKYDSAQYTTACQNPHGIVWYKDYSLWCPAKVFDYRWRHTFEIDDEFVWGKIFGFEENFCVRSTNQLYVYTSESPTPIKRKHFLKLSPELQDKYVRSFALCNTYINNFTKRFVSKFHLENKATKFNMYHRYLDQSGRIELDSRGKRQWLSFYEARDIKLKRIEKQKEAACVTDEDRKSLAEWRYRYDMRAIVEPLVRRRGILGDSKDELIVKRNELIEKYAKINKSTSSYEFGTLEVIVQAGHKLPQRKRPVDEQISFIPSSRQNEFLGHLVRSTQKSKDIIFRLRQHRAVFEQPYKRLKAQEDQLAAMTVESDEKQLQVAEIKKEHCASCDVLATFKCCNVASYCSIKCQVQHKKAHSASCGKDNNDQTDDSSD